MVTLDDARRVIAAAEKKAKQLQRFSSRRNSTMRIRNRGVIFRRESNPRPFGIDRISCDPGLTGLFKWDH